MFINETAGHSRSNMIRLLFGGHDVKWYFCSEQTSLRLPPVLLVSCGHSETAVTSSDAYLPALRYVPKMFPIGSDMFSTYCEEILDRELLLFSAYRRPTFRTFSRNSPIGSRLLFRILSCNVYLKIMSAVLSIMVLCATS